MSCDDLDCLPPGTCEATSVFGPLTILPTVAHGTRVEWELHPRFADPQPHTFTLQVGRTALAAADDWQDVGAPATNTFFLLDDTQRVYGMTNWTHYRVKLVTPLGTYYSRPTAVDATLPWRHRGPYRAMLTAQEKQLRLANGREGYLLKRRLYGPACTLCKPEQLTDDPQTDPQCPVCYGTGYLHGYFDPLPCYYADLGQRFSYNQQDENLGTTDPEAMAVKDVKMLGVPQLFRGDVWVDKQADRRWYIHRVGSAAEYIGQVVLYANVLLLAPMSDVIYQLPITGQGPT